MMDITEIKTENERRNALLNSVYDPISGVGCCGERVAHNGQWLPRAMLDTISHYDILSPVDQARERMKWDFEYWAATCATIKDKLTGRYIKFVLNAPQRRLLATMERQRTSNKPVRIILLKARQWGGTTLVQMYMAWIQIVILKQWNSLICGHLKQTSYAVKRMYNVLLSHYPREYLDEDVKLEFRNFEGSSSVQHLEGRDCLLLLGSSRSEDAVRGYDLAMAHLTEVAFWASTAQHSPEDVMRSVSGTVNLMANTVVVYESTANGVGNFFHSEWIRAKSGNGITEAVFVPWYEIEIYRSVVPDVQTLWESLDDYERELWDGGCTLEMLQWYHTKRQEYATHSLMMAEFPSNDIEAFAGTDRCVFELSKLESMRESCRIPQYTGDVTCHPHTHEVKFVSSPSGNMKVWKMPEPYSHSCRYMAVVDVGGRSDSADYSVIAVLDTHGYDEMQKPEVVAQWRGHMDHDLLAWKAVHVARFYANAHLVIESNTLETEHTDGDAGEFILNQVSRAYTPTYGRSKYRPGFQTNKKTKKHAVYELIAAVREGLYVERDHEAINEMTTYETTSKGGFEAKKGHHDDIVMTRAIGMSVFKEYCSKKLRPIKEEDKKSMVGEVAPSRNPYFDNNCYY